MTIGRAERLLHMVNILRSGKGYSASELAQALGVSERTIYRDVVDLSQQVPIYYDRGYRLLREWHLAGMAFTRDELLSLKLALDRDSTPAGPRCSAGKLRAALAKIDDQLWERFGDRDATYYGQDI
jgi:predicted DNA-binding transcriptional regulator YafY